MRYLTKLATTAERPSVAAPLELVAGRRYTFKPANPVLVGAGATAVAAPTTVATPSVRSKPLSGSTVGTVAPCAIRTFVHVVVTVDDFSAMFADSGALFPGAAGGRAGAANTFGHLHDRARYAGAWVSMSITRRPPRHVFHMLTPHSIDYIQRRIPL